ncbi:MAG: adenosine deaminase [Anaerolineales bacterium]|nr:adenosine deaminase [Anaerolineales bacterium]MCB8940159.1 adenosine deaminase [Ardenticatenaceae bacterium]
MADLKSLPKIDLHRHLEGSLRLETLLEIARKYKLKIPADNLETLRPYVQVTNDPATHEAFLAKFEVLRHFYRTPELIHRLVYEAVADAAEDNIKYLELRFSPQALTRVRGFSMADAADWVIESVAQAEADYDIQVGLIVTLVRHDPIQQARHVAEIAFERYGKGIVGLDLAGDEVKFPSRPFTPLFKEAKQVGLGITVHAGEWASAFGVREAVLDLYADRIGHGVRTLENSEILRLVRDRQTAFEVCLTSNLQTGVVHQMDHHPLVDMLDVGLNATINTDDPSISNCTLTDEYEIAVHRLKIGYTALRQSIMMAAAAAFLPPNGQQALVQKFDALLPESAAVDGRSPLSIS